MILYKEHRKGLFNGYISTPGIDTIEAIVEELIIGETRDTFVTKIINSEIPYCDKMGRYKAKMCSAIGFHKSRLIKWTSNFQLNLFES